MKLFQTGPETVVSDCMNFFHFLPVSHQIDIRIAKFLENFMCSENYICTLFENKADSYLKKISVRCNTMSLQFQSSFELVWSVIVITCFFCVSFSQLLFHFRFTLCCRFWRIKTNRIRNSVRCVRVSAADFSWSAERSTANALRTAFHWSDNETGPGSWWRWTLTSTRSWGARVDARGVSTPASVPSRTSPRYT